VFLVVLWCLLFALAGTGERREALERLLGRGGVPGGGRELVLADRTVDAILGWRSGGAPDCGAPDAAEKLAAWLARQLGERGASRFALDPGPPPRLLGGEVDGWGRFHPRVETPVASCLAEGLARMNRFLARNAAVSARLLSPALVERAMESPRTRREVEAMIARDRDAVYSEVGGFATLWFPPGEPPALLLHPLESALEPITRRIAALAGEPEALIRFVAEQQDDLLLMSEEAAVFVREARKLRDPQRLQRRVALFVDTWLLLARRSYSFSRERFQERLFRRETLGIYAGVFHVHPPDNPPSWEDRVQSMLKRNIVLVPQSGGFDLHYLPPGGAEWSLFRVRDGESRPDPSHAAGKAPESSPPR
jgi:hypothetical protein